MNVLSSSSIVMMNLVKKIAAEESTKLTPLYDTGDSIHGLNIFRTI